MRKWSINVVHCPNSFLKQTNLTHKFHLETIKYLHHAIAWLGMQGALQPIIAHKIWNWKDETIIYLFLRENVVLPMCHKSFWNSSHQKKDPRETWALSVPRPVTQLGVALPLKYAMRRNASNRLFHKIKILLITWLPK